MPGTHQASFSRVYAATRLQLRNAELTPGTQLLVNARAALHGVSATPVREAFAKLAGERLVEDRERLGYFVPLLSCVELVALLELLELYLIRAIDHRRRNPQGAAGVPEAKHLPASDTFPLMDVAACAANPLLVEESQRCLDRSAFARRRETELFGPPAQLPALADMLTQHDWTGLAREIRALLRTSRLRAGAVAHAMASSYRETIVRK